ncbi:MAG TPA: lysine 5,6-aminomutase subunit alpha [Chroococcales cyanobacterium]
MHLPIDVSLVERSRLLAERIARPVLSQVKQQSTVSIERAVLRLLGVDGVDRDGIPWPNRVVDYLLENGMMERGAAYWLGQVILNQDCSAQLAASEIVRGALSKIKEKPLAEIREWGDAMATMRLSSLRQNSEKRFEEREKLGLGQRPWKYLIVATGNIYEDIPQAVAAARQGADIIAVIRTTGQSLLDYVPYGPTTEGMGGTYATGENFHLMRQALDEVGAELGRYIRLVNYASGLCMPEITVLAAQNGLDMLLNDALYGILFRDINIRRTLTDQHFSRLLCASFGITINTGEDNYLTTADAVEEGHTVLASQFINERFALEAGMKPELMGLGHAFEIDPNREDGLLDEIAMAQLVRQVFPDAPLKYMPPTKHINGNVFRAYAQNTLFNLVSAMTHQDIHLLGMLTEAIHTPFLSDRYLGLLNADYLFKTARHLGEELEVKEGGRISLRAEEVLSAATSMLEEVEKAGLFEAIAAGRFAAICRKSDEGKGKDGVFLKAEEYYNPFSEQLEGREKVINQATLAAKK